MQRRDKEPKCTHNTAIYIYIKNKFSGPRKENSLGNRRSLPSNYFKRVGSHACACDADKWPLSDGKQPFWDFESGDRSC